MPEAGPTQQQTQMARRFTMDLVTGPLAGGQGKLTFVQSRTCRLHPTRAPRTPHPEPGVLSNAGGAGICRGLAVAATIQGLCSLQTAVRARVVVSGPTWSPR